VLDAVAIEAVAQLIEQKGSDAWYSATPDEILPRGYAHPQTGETEFRKEVDVFDVWFDSGSTWACVLEGNVEPRWKDKIPCDLYLEGSDQHRGWFNLSMIIGTALTGGAPYDQVLTHGFVSAPDGQKMSKRLGNVIDPVQVCETYGADVLRLWVASVDTTDDTACSDEILKAAGEHYRRIRNTLRFLLGNLYDYDGYDGEMLEIDKWVVDSTHRVAAKCLDSYAKYDFTTVFRLVHWFCDDQLSSFYLDAIKDRMYCDGTDWDTRRSGQKACHDILLTLTKVIAPILMHTSEETYQRIPAITRLPSVHMETYSSQFADSEEFTATNERVSLLFKARGAISQGFEMFKQSGTAKDSQDFVVTVECGGTMLEALRSFGEDLPTFMRVAGVLLESSKNLPVKTLQVAKFEDFARPTERWLKCERSRVRRADVETVSWNGSTVPLSARDRRALGIG